MTVVEPEQSERYQLSPQQEAVFRVEGDAGPVVCVVRTGRHIDPAALAER